MVADPCTAQLLPGLYGSADGLLARVHSTISKPGTESDTCGYILWSPDYSNPGGALSTSANLFTFRNISTTKQPENAGVEVFGRYPVSTFLSGAQPLTTSSPPDPANALATQDLVQDMRCLSACIQITYTGKLQDCSGQLCMLESLPLDSLLHGGTGGGSLSVDDLFRYSNSTHRFGIETAEVVTRPTPNSGTYRDEDDACYNVGDGVGVDTTASPLAESQQPTFFGFAWRGLDVAAANPIVFDLYKNIEWRPTPVSGLAHVPPVAMHDTPPIDSVVKVLDQADANWNTNANKTSMSVFDRVSQASYVGLPQRNSLFYGPNNLGGKILHGLENFAGGFMGVSPDKAGSAFLQGAGRVAFNQLARKMMQREAAAALPMLL